MAITDPRRMLDMPREERDVERCARMHWTPGMMECPVSDALWDLLAKFDKDYDDKIAEWFTHMLGWETCHYCPLWRLQQRYEPYWHSPHHRR